MKIKFKIYTPAPSQAHVGVGELPFANSLCKSLHKLGVEATVICMDDWVHHSAVGADEIALVIRGAFLPYFVKGGGPKLYWLISHPNKLSNIDLDNCDHLFIAADHHHAVFALENQKVSSSVLLQATDSGTFFPTKNYSDISTQLRFVGTAKLNERRRARYLAEKVTSLLRPSVRFFLETEPNYFVHGAGWEDIVPKDRLDTRPLSDVEVAAIYRSSLLVLNDHYSDQLFFGYVNNRVFDVIASGRPIVTDMPALVPDFVKEVASFYDPMMQSSYLTAVEQAKLFGARTRKLRLMSEYVRAHHSFDARAKQILDTLGIKK